MPVGREPPPLDAELILRALADLAVDYVLIGGLAVQTHGHVRTTVDADIVPRPQHEPRSPRPRPHPVGREAAES